MNVMPCRIKVSSIEEGGGRGVGDRVGVPAPVSYGIGTIVGCSGLRVSVSEVTWGKKKRAGTSYGR